MKQKKDSKFQFNLVVLNQCLDPAFNVSVYFPNSVTCQFTRKFFLQSKKLRPILIRVGELYTPFQNRWGIQVQKVGLLGYGGGIEREASFGESKGKKESSL